MKRKQVIFSFDYELFFGERSGTVSKTLIEPTNMLMDCLESVGARGNFFIDYLMFREMEKLNDEKAISDLRSLKDQIQDMVRRGHRIELHLHPHWIDAKYNGDGTWDYSNFTHYSLSSLDDSAITTMFKEGADYLNALAGDVAPGYKICTFRAGGWAIQPFNKIKKGFLAAGIKIDSSVAYGVSSKNQYSYYDFREVPNKVMWRFEEDVCKERQNGHFLEIPISAVRRTFFNKFTDAVMRILSSKLNVITDGTHNRNDLAEVPQKRNLSNMTMLTMSRHTSLTTLLNLLSVKSEICVMIDHPKDFTMSNMISIKWCSKMAKSTMYIDLLKQ